MGLGIRKVAPDWSPKVAQTGASEAGWKALSTSSGNLGASRVGYE